LKGLAGFKRMAVRFGPPVEKTFQGLNPNAAAIV